MQRYENDTITYKNISAKRNRTSGIIILHNENNKFRCNIQYEYLQFAKLFDFLKFIDDYYEEISNNIILNTPLYSMQSEIERCEIKHDDVNKNMLPITEINKYTRVSRDTRGTYAIEPQDTSISPEFRTNIRKYADTNINPHNSVYKSRMMMDIVLNEIDMYCITNDV